jgi:hypothetical protein
LRESLDRKLYYVTRGEDRPTCWLSVEEFPGEVEESKKRPSFFDVGWVQIRKDDGRVYHRKVLDFAVYEVRSGDIESLDESTDLFKDYASTERWSPEFRPLAYVTTVSGEKVRIHPGEWVITEPDGVHHYPCKADVFEATYEPVEEYPDTEVSFS